MPLFAPSNPYTHSHCEQRPAVLCGCSPLYSPLLPVLCAPTLGHPRVNCVWARNCPVVCCEGFQVALVHVGLLAMPAAPFLLLPLTAQVCCCFVSCQVLCGDAAWYTNCRQEPPYGVAEPAASKLQRTMHTAHAQTMSCCCMVNGCAGFKLAPARGAPCCFMFLQRGGCGKSARC